MSLCPHCKIRPKLKGKKTCGVPECQHARYIVSRRKYFDKFERKTDRRVSPSISKVRQQSEELVLR